MTRKRKTSSPRGQKTQSAKLAKRLEPTDDQVQSGSSKSNSDSTTVTQRDDKSHETNPKNTSKPSNHPKLQKEQSASKSLELSPDRCTRIGNNDAEKKSQDSPVHYVNTSNYAAINLVLRSAHLYRLQREKYRNQ